MKDLETKVAELENEAEEDRCSSDQHIFKPLYWTEHTSSRLSRQQAPSIVSLNVHLSRHDLVVQTVHSSDVLVCKHRQREVDQQDQSNSRMQEVRQESSLETTNSGVDDNYNETRLASISKPSRKATQNN